MVVRTRSVPMMSTSAYYAHLYATGSLQGAFSHVYPDTVKALPIPILTEPPPDPPTDWWDRVRESCPGGNLSRQAMRRAFRSRGELASVIGAIAERRQQVEARREKRALISWLS
jgi:hypothetical protein